MDSDKSSENPKKIEQEDKEDTPLPIDRELRSFIRQIEGLYTTFPIVKETTRLLGKDAFEKLKDFLEKHGKEASPSEEGKKAYLLPVEHVADADKLEREADNFRVGFNIIPKQFIVSLVSQYDAFLGRLLRELFYLEPGLMNSSELSLTFAQLVDMQSLEMAKEFIVEKEVEKFLRLSHSDQFEWLEKKFKVPLRKELSVWPKFIELTERRNLFVHCNGVVSSQYLGICRAHGVEFPKGAPKVGTRLGTTEKYFERAYRCVFEIGAKLSQVLWRKLSKDKLDAPDNSLIEITYDLIVAEQYRLALSLLDFGTNVIKRHSSEARRRVMLINRAQAYKWLGKQQECSKILDAEDWSACGHRFQLAVSVLKDDFKMAKEFMEAIGSAGEMRETDYKNWPLFKEFRKSEEFLKAYESVYSKPFGGVVLTAAEPTAVESQGEAGNQSQEGKQ